jgi:virginiamycin B lyase
MVPTLASSNVLVRIPSRVDRSRTFTAGVVTEFSIPTPNALPTSITTGPDGNVYFIESGVTNGGFGALHIGPLTPTGKIARFVIPQPPVTPERIVIR